MFIKGRERERERETDRQTDRRTETRKTGREKIVRVAAIIYLSKRKKKIVRVAAFARRRDRTGSERPLNIKFKGPTK